MVYTLCAATNNEVAKKNIHATVFLTHILAFIFRFILFAIIEKVILELYIFIYRKCIFPHKGITFF